MLVYVMTMPKRGRTSATPGIFRLALVLALAFPWAARAQFYFQALEGGSTLIRYTGPGGDVEIPATFGGFPVTVIGESAFDRCSNVTRVAIPDSVTSIGFMAFRYCTNLASVTLPDSVTNLGAQAFLGCAGLTNVTLGSNLTSIAALSFIGCSNLCRITIPASVTSIRYNPFAQCWSLTNITVAEDNPIYASQSGVLFNKQRTTLLAFPGGLAGGYDIPNGIGAIGPDSFTGAIRLKNVTIPASVTNIGWDAFAASGLTDVTIPDTIGLIGDSAFLLCQGLTNVTLGNGVRTIGEWAFGRCAGLTSMTIPDNVTFIRPYAFYHCTNLSSLFIGDGVTRIEFAAFSGCSSLTSVIIPDSVAEIGGYAFADCSNLATAYFQGDSPFDEGTSFYGSRATVYYLAGTTGWLGTFGGVSTVKWSPRILTDNGGLGVHLGRLSFTIMGAPNVRMAVEACADLALPEWTTVTRLNCEADGTVRFTDPSPAGHGNRYFRFRPE